MSHLLRLIAPILVIMAVAVLIAAVLGRAFGMPPETGRLVSLDGLRGYLALAVFAHHATMWRAYVMPDRSWFPKPEVRLYMHLGLSAVTLFFMMTGFLFGAKLAEGRTHPTDWPRLYVSRVFRIYPLFLLQFAAVMVIVAIESRARLLVPPMTLARGVLAWARFARPDLDGMHDTWTATAGVTWSLQYEWLFYSVLPLAALLFGARPPRKWIVASVIGTAMWGYWVVDGFHLVHLAAFGVGVLASVITRPVRVRAALTAPLAACVALASLIAVPLLVDPYTWGALALLAAFFIVVASGNTLFGILRLAASRLLGEISYSIYLLHGLLLFVTLRYVTGMPTAAALATPAYWALIAAIVPVLVGCSFVTFRLVERPAIRATPHVQRWLVERQAASANRRRRLATQGSRSGSVLSKQPPA